VIQGFLLRTRPAGFSEMLACERKSRVMGTRLAAVMAPCGSSPRGWVKRSPAMLRPSRNQGTYGRVSPGNGQVVDPASGDTSWSQNGGLGVGPER
jgi:hypothetical protein